MVCAAIALLLALPVLAHATHRPKRAAPRKAKRGWWAHVARAHARQPDWITPLVTVTPLLEEEVRFDEVRQVAPNGSVTLGSFDGKGLELIPTDRIEVIAGIPAYFHRGTGSTARSGWGDYPMLMKYRMFSAPESKGDYILTTELGLSFPTGTNGNSAGKTIFRPTIGFGKGWGDFDAQGTFGAALPAGTWQRLGTPLALNVAFQYRVLRKLWPQVEVSSTAWPNGSDQGKKETFLTPGMVVGRLPFWGRVGLAIGAGVQIATTHFHRSNHNVIFTVRFPF